MTTPATDTAGEAPDAELRPGTRVGEYQIEGELGRGGFGTVYRAVHPVIGKQAAIKVLSQRFSSDPAMVSRFHAEAKAVNQIRHRNIIDIFSFGQLDDRRCYYVMELLEGETLDRAIVREPLPLDQALAILRGLARALDAAHAKGIAHRDLKPENVFLARDSDGIVRPKLLDFGIAKLLAPEPGTGHRTVTGVPMGTPYYMSPEQCRGRDIDHRTDAYSFGVMTYRVLTGRLPFVGDFMELMMAHVNAEPVPPTHLVPSLPPSVDTAIAWMMRKDRAQRPGTLVEAVVALDPSRAAKPSVPPPIRTNTGGLGNTNTLAPLPPRSLPRPQPRRWPIVVGVLAVIVAVAVVASMIGGNASGPQGSPEAAPSATAPAGQGSAAVPATVVAPKASAPASPPHPTAATPAGGEAAKPRDHGSEPKPSEPAGAGGSGDIIHLENGAFGSQR